MVLSDCFKMEIPRAEDVERHWTALDMSKWLYAISFSDHRGWLLPKSQLICVYNLNQITNNGWAPCPFGLRTYSNQTYGPWSLSKIRKYNWYFAMFNHDPWCLIISCTWECTEITFINTNRWHWLCDNETNVSSWLNSFILETHWS